MPNNGARPNANGTCPNINGARPNVDGTRPNVNGARPNVNGARPNVNGTRPIKITIGLNLMEHPNAKSGPRRSRFLGFSTGISRGIYDLGAEGLALAALEFAVCGLWAGKTGMVSPVLAVAVRERMPVARTSVCTRKFPAL